MTFFDRGFAVVIGIADYLHVRKLPPIVLDDATAFTATLQNPDYCGYHENNVRLLVDTQADTDGIRGGIRWLAERTEGGDTAVLYFSGHGGRIENGSLADNYLIAHDTNLSDLKNTAIGSKELTIMLRQIKAGRLLVFFDCCHAGGIGAVKDAGLTSLPVFKTGLDEGLYDRLGEGNGRAIIASSRSHETSLIMDGMGNSLFTHYLLQALRGQAPTRGDGLIRLFDVFDFVSQQVVARYHNQHPVLKAELENNFPIALHLGGGTAVPPPPGQPAQLNIQNFRNFPLSSWERDVLMTMFANHERLVIKDEFGSGFSGGRVFLVRPIAPHGAELPAVIKTGPAPLIQKEWNAFTRYVRQKVPNVAQVEGYPIYSDDDKWGGIRYPLAGDGRFYTESLREFCRHAAVEDVVYVLEQRLFNSIGELWQDNRIEREVYLADRFDLVLPVNLRVGLATAPPGTAVQSVTPQKVRRQTFRVGDWVEIAGFSVAEVDDSKGEVTLNVTTAHGERLPDSYRLRITAVPNLAQYREGQPIPQPITGVIQATRQMLLQTYAEAVFDSMDVMAQSIKLPNIDAFPNPLLALLQILNETQDIRVAPIHGDLNLENILVEYDHRSHNIHLIDFANARYDYVLHDLLRLEAGFWLYLLPEEMERNGRSLADLPSFLHALHTFNPSCPVPGLGKSFAVLTAVRRHVQHLLVNPQSWDEYYRGLTIYLLGALKFKNLNELPTAPLPKQVAFLVTAVIQQIPAQPSAPSSPPPTTPPQPFDPTMTKSQLIRNIRRLLRSLEIFESDYELRSVFENYEEMHPFMDRLPGARARKPRVDKTVAFLQNKRHANGQNVLILFLRILSIEYEDDRVLSSQLSKFADQLEALLK